MKKKVWTDEKVKWLKDHAYMEKPEAWREFNKAFPDHNTTVNGFVTKRSEIGAVPYHCYNSRVQCRPLYSEHLKKGYVWIKVAQPNVWIPKHKWVWMETHPWLINTIDEKNDTFVFLDGDIRNFSPDNIEKVNRRIMGIMNYNVGKCGFVKGNAELTRLNIAKSTLLLAINDKGEKLDMVVNYGSGRVSRQTVKERRQVYYYKNRDKMLQQARERRKNITPEQRERIRENARKNYRKRKAREKLLQE